MISQDQFNIGLQFLKKFLKEVNIKVDGTKVVYTQVFDLEDEKIARNFAETLKKQYE
jgi:hypothetical protein